MKKGEDGEEIPINEPRSRRKITSPLTKPVADLKGKGVAASPEKRKKKSKEPPTREVPKKKRKLLYTTTSAMKKLKYTLCSVSDT